MKFKINLFIVYLNKFSLDLVSPNAFFGRKINNNDIDIVGLDNFGKNYI